MTAPISPKVGDSFTNTADHLDPAIIAAFKYGSEPDLPAEFEGSAYHLVRDDRLPDLAEVHLIGSERTGHDIILQVRRIGDGIASRHQGSVQIDEAPPMALGESPVNGVDAQEFGGAARFADPVEDTGDEIAIVPGIPDHGVDNAPEGPVSPGQPISVRPTQIH